MSAQPTSMNAPSILVTDDEPGIREVLEWELGARGYHVALACDGHEALSRFRAADFDVVILDMRMPGMSGLETLREIRDASKDVEVIVATGYAELETAIACLRAGAFDLLHKPFDLEEMVAAVGRAIEHRRLRTEASLLEASSVILSPPDPRRLPSEIVRVTHHAMGADDVSLMLVSPDGSLYIAESEGLEPSQRAEVLSMGSRVAGRVAELGEAVLIQNPLSEDPRFSDVPSFGRVRSSIVFPIYSKSRLVAVLNINRVANPRSFRKSDLERARVLASQVLLAIENRDLLEGNAKSERLAAIGHIAAGVAHEINNPLTYVVASHDYLRRRLPEFLEFLASLEGKAPTGPGSLEEMTSLTRELMECVAEAEDAMAQVRTIAKDLGALSRGSSERLSMDLNAAVASALRFAGPELRHRAKVTTKLGPNVDVFGCHGQLVQVFVNLLVNAAHAVAAVDAKDKQVTVITQRVGDWAVVRVSDTGTGVEPRLRPRLFEPYFTTKGSGGTGLGLAISRDIVVSHGGELRYEPGSGRGSEFVVTLPPLEPNASAVIPISSPRKPSVLFVDDEVRVLKGLERVFQKSLEVLTAAGGREALAIFERRQDFDMIVCDLMMPDLSGPELYKAAISKHPSLETAFVFMSGGAPRPDVAAFLASSRHPFLEKPFETSQLLDLVKERISKPGSG